MLQIQDITWKQSYQLTPFSTDNTSSTYKLCGLKQVSPTHGGLVYSSLEWRCGFLPYRLAPNEVVLWAIRIALWSSPAASHSHGPHLEGRPHKVLPPDLLSTGPVSSLVLWQDPQPQTLQSLNMERQGRRDSHIFYDRYEHNPKLWYQTAVLLGKALALYSPWKLC